MIKTGGCVTAQCCVTLTLIASRTPNSLACCVPLKTQRIKHDLLTNYFACKRIFSDVNTVNQRDVVLIEFTFHNTNFPKLKFLHACAISEIA